jgi:hypothetical protein
VLFRFFPHASDQSAAPNNDLPNCYYHWLFNTLFLHWRLICIAWGTNHLCTNICFPYIPPDGLLAVLIRRKFSVRAFSADLVKYECRALQYIGELCRYLCNAPANPDDDKVRIDYAIGNGMRPDVWEKFQVRTLL